jgi:hypothetical protein
MSNGRNSAEVATFLSLYTRVKDWCDDDPDALFQLAMDDQKFKGLSRQLIDAVERLHASEQSRRQLFVAPVDPKFWSRRGFAGNMGLR